MFEERRCARSDGVLLRQFRHACRERPQHTGTSCGAVVCAHARYLAFEKRLMITECSASYESSQWTDACCRALTWHTGATDRCIWHPPPNGRHHSSTRRTGRGLGHGAFRRLHGIPFPSCRFLWLDMARQVSVYIVT